MRLFFIIAVVLFASACNADDAQLCETEARYEKASIFSDLVQKVAAEYAFSDVSELSIDDVIDEVASTDENYKIILRQFNIQTKIENGNISMMMCDGNELIIEDAGCTAKVERVLACGERPACEFTLELSNLCMQ